jgi:UDP-N-acetylmuramate: L-alanyl-gamma-D-glutamyl-meso-diaminopimelate ligase
MNEHTNKAFEYIYSKNQDKQRIAIVGQHATMVFQMVKHVLNQHHKKADFLTDSELTNYESRSFTNAPVIIINPSGLNSNLAYFKAHLLVVTNLSEKSELPVAESVANTLPKSGILIIDDRDALLGISKKERSDVLTITFKPYNHLNGNEGVTLITSTNERVNVNLSGEENLRCISAAKEIVKRIGISSGQFYRAITTFES